MLKAIAFACSLTFACSSAQAHHVAPPYEGTVFVSPDILTDQDPSTFDRLAYIGKRQHASYNHDRDEETWEKFYLFDAEYSDGEIVQMYISRNFSSKEESAEIAQTYAFVAGQMPAVLRENILEIHIHPNGEDWSANSDGTIVIDHGNFEEERADGALEESMMHEAVHTTLDEFYYETEDWYDAMDADDTFISGYAEALPDDEDLAETFVLYYGLAVRPERMEKTDRETIVTTIPARLALLAQWFPKSNLGL